MNSKQVLLALIIVFLFQIILAVMVLSSKSDIGLLKGQVSTLQEFIDWQMEWNLIPTSTDTLLDKRVDMLEQKMRKVYQGYDVKPSKFYDLDSLYRRLRLGLESEGIMILHNGFSWRASQIK